MVTAQPDSVAQTTRQMRALLWTAATLVLIAGVQLFVLSEHTDRYFAWTIRPPLTAAFLGAAYWSSFMLQALAARRIEWARTRIAVPTALTFTTLTLVTTLLHLDKFHFGSTNLGAQVAAWAWLAVYVGVPPIFLLIIVRQLRVPGGDPPRLMPIPRAIRGMLMVQGGILAFAGLLLFAIPQVVGPIWPWSLTPLTGRAIGAWLVAMAVAAFHTLWEDDLDRVVPGMAAYAVFGTLQVWALVRYGVWASWSEPGAWLYLFLCLSMIVVATAAILAWRRQVRSASLQADHLRTLATRPSREA